MLFSRENGRAMAFQDEAYKIKSRRFAADGQRLRKIGTACLAIIVVAAVAILWFDPFRGGLTIEAQADQSANEEASEAIDVAGQTADPPAAKIVVFVSGCVKSPGVYELDEGSRVIQAIDASGGFTEEAAKESLNLARQLVDGEQIAVPTQEEVASAATGAQEGASATTASGSVINGKVNINRATSEELQTLSGIGEATAQKIIAEREANGPFSSPEDLMRVSGIGEKKYEAIADFITIG